MVKLEIDTFYGYKIYPYKGKLFVRGDGKVSYLDLALSSANESLVVDLPVQHVQERVSDAPAQEPAQDRLDRRIPPHAQEGYHRGGRKEARAQERQAPAWHRRRW